jgi:hypothetical protein
MTKGSLELIFTPNNHPVRPETDAPFVPFYSGRISLETTVMKSRVRWVSGGPPRPRVRRVKPGDGTSVMAAPERNHLEQKRSVSMSRSLTQNLFAASAID